jgi:hypothetical protein
MNNSNTPNQPRRKPARPLGRRRDRWRWHRELSLDAMSQLSSHLGGRGKLAADSAAQHSVAGLRERR